MVYFMENPIKIIKMDDLRGFPPIFGNSHMAEQRFVGLLKDSSGQAWDEIRLYPISMGR